MRSALLLVSVMAVCLQGNGLPAGNTPDTQAVTPQLQVRSELQIYAAARSVVDMSPPELIAAFPELTVNLTFADQQDELGPLLKKIGENVRDFFDHFPNTSTVEEIIQERFRPTGERTARASNSYLYLMLPRMRALMDFEEYRTDRDGKPLDLRGLERGFMVSFAFAWNLMHIHPVFQPDSRFRRLGLDPKSGAHVIAFAQKPEAARTVGIIGVADPAVLNRSVQILIQGFVWADPKNGQIIRMHNELLAPRYDIGLARNSTDIECEEVHFERVGRSFWLPREVLVTCTYRNEIFRNRHRYSKYQIFTVETQDKVKIPVIPPDPP